MKRFYILFLISHLLLSHLLAQNTLLDKKISIIAQNKKLVDVLDEIQKSAGLEFSYNSNLIPSTITTSINAKNKTVKEILTQLFNNYNLNFSELNKQIVIYKRKGSKTIYKKPLPKPKPKTEPKPKIKVITVYDTVISVLHDTIINTSYDTVTVYHHDTLVYYDTMRTELQSPKDTAWSVEVYGNVFYPLGYSIKPSSSQQQENVTLLKDATTPSLCYSIGANINYLFKKWSIKSGISYTSLNEKLNFNYTKNKIDTSFSYSYTNSDIWITDTITFYYEITGTDTTTVYITEPKLITTTDSALAPDYDTNRTANEYSGINSYTYLEIPFIMGYELATNKRWSIAINGGIIAGILISTKGKTIDENRNLLSTHKNNYIKPLFSFALGLAVQYQLNDKISLSFTPHYRQNIQSVFSKKYYLSKKYRYAGVGLGLRYKL